MTELRWLVPKITERMVDAAQVPGESKFSCKIRLGRENSRILQFRTLFGEWTDVPTVTEE